MSSFTNKTPKPSTRGDDDAVRARTTQYGMKVELVNLFESQAGSAFIPDLVTQLRKWMRFSAEAPDKVEQFDEKITCVNDYSEMFVGSWGLEHSDLTAANLAHVRGKDKRVAWRLMGYLLQYAMSAKFHPAFRYKYVTKHAFEERFDNCGMKRGKDLNGFQSIEDGKLVLPGFGCNRPVWGDKRMIAVIHRSGLRGFRRHRSDAQVRAQAERLRL